MKNILDQATNKVNIVGKLLDATFNTGTTKTGTPYERATLTIRVTQTYGGHEETSEIPVSMFASQYTSKGSINPAFTSIQEVKKMHTAKSVGIDAADTIRITNGNVRENYFVSKSGQLVQNWQLNASFASSASIADVASFVLDIYIMDMKDEVNKNDEPTGRLIIKGGLVQYNGKLDVLEFIVENPDAVDYISRNWQIDDTVTVVGRVRVTSIESKSSGADSSWGEDIPDVGTHMVRELIITKGDDEGKEEDFAYDPTDIRKAFNVRKAQIEQLQIDAKKGTAPKTAQNPQSAKTSNFDWEY